MALYSFIALEKADAESVWSVAELCRTMEVSRSGFCDWQRRGPSEREVSDVQLAGEMEAIFLASDQTYGAPRVHAWLARHGFGVGRNRVARIMAGKGWVGQMGRRSGPRTTIADKTATVSRDLVERDFDPAAPDEVWVGDITYVPTGEGWLYLATVIDLFSRRVIGWSLADHMRAELVCDALRMATATRGGHAEGVIFHSDRGCQYTSGEYRQLCQQASVRQSMGATGVCWDNAAAEALSL